MVEPHLAVVSENVAEEANGRSEQSAAFFAMRNEVKRTRAACASASSCRSSSLSPTLTLTYASAVPLVARRQARRTARGRVLCISADAPYSGGVERVSERERSVASGLTTCRRPLRPRLNG